MSDCIISTHELVLKSEIIFFTSTSFSRTVIFYDVFNFVFFMPNFLSAFKADDWDMLFICLPLWAFGFLYYSILYLHPPKEVTIVLSGIPLAIWILLSLTAGFYLEKAGISPEHLKQKIVDSSALKYFLSALFAVHGAFWLINTFRNFKRYFNRETLLFPGRYQGRVELPSGIGSILLNFLGLFLAIFSCAYSLKLLN